MDYSGRTTTTITAPAHGPMDLNVGKPDWRELAPLLGVMLLALVPVGIGGALVKVSWPTESEVSGWQMLGLLVGGLMMFGGGSWFWTLRDIAPRMINRWQQRLDDWHYATLNKYEASDGQVQATQVSEWHLSTHDARHMLIFLVYVYLTGKTPTIRSLTEGPLLVRAGHRAYSLGTMSQGEAADACNLLARSGLMIDRDARKAGRVVVMDFRAAAQRVLAELSRDPKVLDAEVIE